MKWFPSNGTEGMVMTERFCQRCIHDTQQSCDIIAKSLLCDPEDGPEQWQADDCRGRNLRCTAFIPIEWSHKP